VVAALMVFRSARKTGESSDGSVDP